MGIKGTGMSALAELLHHRGVRVSGSDTAEEFYTDGILRDLRIPYREGFSPDNIPADTLLVVRSAAYTGENNPECAAAVKRRLPLASYPEALGAFAEAFRFAGIAGIHGKTTTTAMVGTMLKETALPVSVLVGSSVPAFHDRSTWSGGKDFFVAETCEYRRHFLNFKPRWIVVTNVEADHLDYFKDADDVLDAFTEYAAGLEPEGELIYCADDPGAVNLAARMTKARPDVNLIPYGFNAEGEYRLISAETQPGRSVFTLAGVGELTLRLPGRHMILNAAAAAALSRRMLAFHFGQVDEDSWEKARQSLAGYSGCRRRTEILGEAGGILFIDDYGHHPTEIRTTLEGYREFYPHRRRVVDFMSHTYSRTEKLLDGFARAFEAADLVILHAVYASAREKVGNVDGLRLYEEVKKHHRKVVYFPGVMEAADFCRKELQPGDLFITMGAGNNWVLGRSLYDSLRQEEGIR